MNERVRLEILLAEMRLWGERGRVPEAILRPLYAEYVARHRALLHPTTEFDLSDEPGATAPARESKAAPWADLTAFLERKNIAALHVVGAMLVLVGVVALVQWQWASWGRGILWGLLVLASGGLILGGDRLAKTEPQSGRTLGLIGTALVPVCCIAGQALGLTDGLLTWPLALLVTGAISAAVSLARLRVTRDPLLIPLLGAGAALAVGAGAALLPPGGLSVAVREVGWLALAAGAISFAKNFPSESEIAPSAPSNGGTKAALLGTGLSLLCLALGGGLWELIDGSRTSGGFALLGAALVGGFAASALELPLLAYFASASLLAGTLALTPDARSSGVLHGATLAVAGLVLALTATLHRRNSLGADAPYRHASWAGAMLAALAFVPGVGSNDASLGTIFALVSAAWLFLAKSEGDDEVSLGAAAGIGLLATRLAAIPLDAWLVRVTGIAPSPERWLLVSALALGFSKRRSLRAVALGALAWACAFQLPLLVGRSPERSAGILTLLLAASGTALWSRLARSTTASYIALAPLGVALVATWSYWSGWLFSFSPIWPALALGICAIAANGRALRGTLLWLGAAHLGALLPNDLLDFWPLATLPVALYLARPEDDDLPAALGAVTFGVFLAISAPESLPLGVVGGAFGLLALAVGWIRERTLSLGLGAGVASVTGVLCWAGFPHWHPTVAQTGLAVTFVALLWQAVAAALQGTTEKRWRTLSGVGLIASAVAATLALIGAPEENQGRTAVMALALTGVTLFGAARLRGSLNCLHAGFFSCLAAFGLFLFDRIGFGPDRLDWFLLPLGLYVLAVAELSHQPSLRLPGLLFLLAPSLLASYLTPDLWAHAVVLAALCVACVLAGIARHVRTYLGSGVAFLIALLAIRLWEPLTAINYGVYLTALGVGVLWLAIRFERRREAVLAWAHSVKEKYEGWE